MNKVIEVKHPLVTHKLSIMRNKETSTSEFRQLTFEITSLLTFEATKHFEMESVKISTPVCDTQNQKCSGKKPAVISILRAGNGMLEGMLSVMPSARVGFVGLERDEKTLEPRQYYYKVPQNMDERNVIVVDPMLATGGSAVSALNLLKKENPKSITFVCLVAAPEGIKALQTAHQNVDIVVASIDEKLNKNGYIVPGLGDAGDRIFGTLKKEK
ncbi:MAG: uracil phosphoribosyltransferase [Alphaproteobacteria bacterium]|nr:uracil phosphoribosyltransferase [Alphaproteobacteria bacterium]